MKHATNHQRDPQPEIPPALECQSYGASLCTARLATNRPSSAPISLWFVTGHKKRDGLRFTIPNVYAVWDNGTGIHPRCAYPLAVSKSAERGTLSLDPTVSWRGSEAQDRGFPAVARDTGRNVTVHSLVGRRDAPPTRRCSERKPADSLRDKSNVIGGWLPWASALSPASFSRPPMPLPDLSDAALLLLGHGTDLDPQSSAPVYRTRGGIAAARELQMRLAWRASQINLFVWNGLLTRAPTGIFFCWPWPFMG